MGKRKEKLVYVFASSFSTSIENLGMILNTYHKTYINLRASNQQQVFTECLLYLVQALNLIGSMLTIDKEFQVKEEKAQSKINTLEENFKETHKCRDELRKEANTSNDIQVEAKKTFVKKKSFPRSKRVKSP